jgi:hypothetical protein
MAITYYMLQIPVWLFFILIVSFCALFAGVVTYYFRKHVSLKILRSHNEVTGVFVFGHCQFLCPAAQLCGIGGVGSVKRNQGQRKQRG